jgi:D-alanyl-D-alanine carboxypeptidase
MRRSGMARPLPVIGHSAAGPGSVGAVYHTPHGCRTAAFAAFAAGADEGIAEDEALRHIARG